MKKHLLPLLLALLCLLAGCAAQPATSAAASSAAASSSAAEADATPEPTPTPAPPLAFTIEVPTGFTAQDAEDLEEQGIAFGWWAKDGSNIGLSITDNIPGSYESVDGEFLRTNLEDVLKEVMGDSVEVTLEDFNRGIFKGYRMYRCKLHVEVPDLKMDMLRTTLYIESDKTYTWLFTDRNDRYQDAFEDCIKTMQIAPAAPGEKTVHTDEDEEEAEPTASPSATPKASPSATPKASPSATPKASPSAAPKASPSATPEASPSATPKKK